ncbi:MAG: MerR family transcriptional regulator [Deltaproteobacteria bacterium]|nr:MerR family transcriptional regulator [Deltaproteobacteria bacterium]
MAYVELPDKLYFKIGEVGDIVGVRQHVLRYWESEFPSIRPQKSKTNQRLYRRKDVEAVLAIRHLLYDRKFTIEGAKQHLKEQGVEASLPPVDVETVVESVRQKTIEELSIEVACAKKGVRDEYEKALLEIRTELQRFLSCWRKDETP